MTNTAVAISEEEEDDEATVIFLLDDEDSSSTTARDLQQANVIDQGREMPDKADMSHMMKKNRE